MHPKSLTATQAFDAVKGIAGKVRTLPIIDGVAYRDAAESLVAMTDLVSVAYLPTNGDDSCDVAIGGWRDVVKLPEARRGAWEYRAGDPADMPGLPLPADGLGLPLPASVAGALSWVASAAESEKYGTRPTLQGVALRLYKDTLEAVGCDGYRLHLARGHVERGSAAIRPPFLERAAIGQTWIIPANVADALGKLAARGCEVRMQLGQNSAGVETLTFRAWHPGNARTVAVIVTRPAGLRFPDYHQIIPRDDDRPAFTESAAQCRALCASITARHAADKRRGQDVDTGDYLFPTPRGVASTDYISAAVAYGPADAPLVMRQRDKDAPVTVAPVDGDDWLALVMPMQSSPKRR